MTISRSRQKRIRKQSKTIPLKGNGTDSGKYYRCWNCGFICDIGRDTLGDQDTRNGMRSKAFAPRSFPTEAADHKSIVGGVEIAHTSCKLGSDGTPAGLREDFKPVVSGGCPFCGTLNWK